MTECDTDRSYSRATYAVIKGALLLTLCDHCALYTPRLGNALTHDGWEAMRLVEAKVVEPA